MRANMLRISKEKSKSTNLFLFQIELNQRLEKNMARRIDRSEIPNATNSQLHEQIEIRKNELQEATLAMQKTEKVVHKHEAEVNNLRANIIHLQQLKAQMQQQLQQGHGQ